MNYIIATYSGTAIEYSLELQMQNLYVILMNKKTQYLKQVTIVCPPVKPEHTCKQNYYNKEKWLNLFKNELPYINLVYIDYCGENKHASYDQWLQAIIAFPNFEYYLLIEDDYCIHPSVLDFDIQIIDTYKKLVGENNIGYVCTYADAIYGQPNIHPYHAVISNGIINRNTIDKFCNCNIIDLYYQRTLECQVQQIGFSDLFLKHNIPVYSMHDIYKAIFWSSFRKQVELYSKNVMNYMFIPIQFFLMQNV